MEVQNGSFGNKGCRPLDYTKADYVPRIVVTVALPWSQAGEKSKRVTEAHVPVGLVLNLVEDSRSYGCCQAKQGVLWSLGYP